MKKCQERNFLLWRFKAEPHIKLSTSKHNGWALKVSFRSTAPLNYQFAPA